MKLFYLLVFTFLFSTVSKAQYEVNTGYTISVPLHQMKSNINPVHQFTLAGSRQLPGKFKLVSLGLDYGIGSYANLRMPTTFSFGNGNPTTTYVNYSSNVMQANAGVQVQLLQNFFIQPYLLAKVGVQSWFSNINVEDPNDIDGCHPLEKKSILKDHTGTISYGGGLKIDMNTFLNIKEKGKHYLNISVSTTRGGNIEYINTRNLKNHDHTATTGDGGKPLNMKFINVTSNVIHDHPVAEIYTTPLRLLDCKISYTIKL